MTQDWPKIEYEQDSRGKWRWKLVARNGRIVDASSQGYIRKIDCINNAVYIADKMHGALRRARFES